MSGGSRDVKMQMQNKEKPSLTMHARLPHLGRCFLDFNGRELHIASLHRRGVSVLDFGRQVSLKFFEGIKHFSKDFNKTYVRRNTKLRNTRRTNVNATLFFRLF